MDFKLWLKSSVISLGLVLLFDGISLGLLVLSGMREGFLYGSLRETEVPIASSKLFQSMYMYLCSLCILVLDGMILSLGGLILVLGYDFQFRGMILILIRSCRV